MLEPNKKSEKKLREKLHVLYGNLDKSATEGPEVNFVKIFIILRFKFISLIDEMTIHC